jgi:hypothetical protein
MYVRGLAVRQRWCVVGPSVELAGGGGLMTTGVPIGNIGAAHSSCTNTPKQTRRNVMSIATAREGS